MKKDTLATDVLRAEKKKATVWKVAANVFAVIGIIEAVIIF